MIFLKKIEMICIKTSSISIKATAGGRITSLEVGFLACSTFFNELRKTDAMM